MYPVVFSFEIPYLGHTFELSSFGVMMALGFFAAGWLHAKNYEEAGLDPDLAWSLLLWAAIGGIVGAKLWYVAEQVARGSTVFEAFFPGGSLSSFRGGLTWYGGFVGGTVAVIAMGRRYGLPLLQFVDLTAPPAALGQMLGRVGCFLVGDDYGRPTDVAWAVAFPKGLPPTPPGVEVHPTMLYEAAWLGLITIVLWKRRGSSPCVFAEYLFLGGLGRLVNEVWRTNPALIGPFTNAQVFALVLMTVGGALWLFLWNRRRIAAYQAG